MTIKFFGTKGIDGMNNTIAEQLYRHAIHNYEIDGWDFIVNCLTIENITEDLIREKILTLQQAIEYYSNLYLDIKKSKI